MKCFVTGATGHIGNVLVKDLSKKGYEVTSLVLKDDDITYIEPYTKIVFGDILNKSELVEIIEDFDVVFHLAGIVEIRFGRKKQLYRVNVEGTRNILEVCQRNKIRRLVYVSSVHAIPEKPSNEIIYEPSEFDPKRIKGHYAKTKTIATNLILSQNESSLETLVVYPSGIIGPYDYKLSNFGQVFTDYLLGRLVAYIKGGYNFVDVRDVSKGIIAAYEKGNDKEGYILSGNQISVKELLDYIAEYTGRKKVKMKIAYWFIKSISYIAEMYYLLIRRRPLFTHYAVSVLNTNHNFSNELAKKKLGFQTRDIKESIRDTVDFAREFYLIKVGDKFKKKIF
jgi:dihydroflavonol-4-reductase